jgi:hypothetical protein
MIRPNGRQHEPHTAPTKHRPSDGETVRVRDHILVLTPTFVKKMNDYYDSHVSFARPGDPANTGKAAVARDLAPVVTRCYYVPPDSCDTPIDRGRIAFRHADFPGRLFIAVLEGVTPTRPVGELTFISMIHERKPPADRRAEVPPPPLIDWPDPDCPPAEALVRLEKAKVALNVWIKACPDRHPRLDDAYADLRAVNDEITRVMQLPVDDFGDLDFGNEDE